MKISAINEVVSVSARQSSKDSQKCPLCREPLRSEDQLYTCSNCGTAHHKECAEEMGGCSTLGCSRKNVLPSDISKQAWMDNLDLHPEERYVVEKMLQHIRRRGSEEHPKFGFPRRLSMIAGRFYQVYKDWGWVVDPGVEGRRVMPQQRFAHTRDLWNLVKTDGEYSQLEMRPKLQQGPPKPEKEPEKERHFGQRMMDRLSKLLK